MIIILFASLCATAGGAAMFSWLSMHTPTYEKTKITRDNLHIKCDITQNWTLFYRICKSSKSQHNKKIRMTGNKGKTHIRFHLNIIWFLKEEL